MKTTLIRCVQARIAVDELERQEWDYAAAYALMRLKKALQQAVEFYVQEENRLTQEYGQTDEHGKVAFTERGTFRFKDPALAPEYNARRMELAGVETELDWEPAELPQPQKIRPVHLEALEGFVRFGGEDG